MWGDFFIGIIYSMKNSAQKYNIITSRSYFSHIFEMFDYANMRSGLYPFFHIALLNDVGSFALCMSDKLFDTAHSSTTSHSLSLEVYPQSVL